MDSTAIVIRFIYTYTHAQTYRHAAKNNNRTVNKRETCLECPCINFVILNRKYKL